MRITTRAPRILIAEDDEAIVELLVTRLELAGYETRAERNGWQAFSSIKSMQPNAVLLDITMPGMDGFSVLKSMRQVPALAKIPVMMLTARGERADVAQAIALGAKDYLTKPFDDRELLQRVARLVRPPHPSTPPPPATPDDGAHLI